MTSCVECICVPYVQHVKDEAEHVLYALDRRHSIVSNQASPSELKSPSDAVEVSPAMPHVTANCRFREAAERELSA